MDFDKIITGLQHIGLPINDMDRTITFYKSIGFEVAMETVNAKAGERVAFLRNKNLMIEAYENHAAAMQSGAIDHICMDVTDVEAVYEYLKQNGYMILNDRIEFLPFWENGVRFFTIEGPNKEKIEFCQKL